MVDTSVVDSKYVWKEVQVKEHDRNVSVVLYGPEDYKTSDARDDELRFLFVHGWLDNAASFTALVPEIQVALKPKRCIFAALDLPGHGVSEHLHADGVYSLPLYANSILAVLKSLQWKSIILVGHSMGAGISLLLAAASPPGCINKLILIDWIGDVHRKHLVVNPDRTSLDVELPRALVQMKRFFRGYADLEDDRKTRRKYQSREELIQRLMKDHVGKLSHDAAERLVLRGSVSIEVELDDSNDSGIIPSSTEVIRVKEKVNDHDPGDLSIVSDNFPTNTQEEDSVKPSGKRKTLFRFSHDPRSKIGDGMMFYERDLVAFASSLEIPVLLIVFRQGLYKALFEMQAKSTKLSDHQRIPGILLERFRLFVSPGCSIGALDGYHHEHMETPEMVADAIARFADALTPRPSKL